MLLDATCRPSDVQYPADILLFNHARELTEQIIDGLHEQLVHPGYIKLRTYRKIAGKVHLVFAKKRKYTQVQLRAAVRQQLQYVRRNLDMIIKQIELGADEYKRISEFYVMNADRLHSAAVGGYIHV